MAPSLHLMFEAHPSALTIHLHGVLSLEAARDLADRCHRLPAVRVLRIDPHGLWLCDVQALELLAVLLHAWEAARCAIALIPRRPPPSRTARDAFVAIPCAVRDAAEAG